MHKISFTYRDASNYKTNFDIDTNDVKDLKVGDEVDMGDYGTPRQLDFFNSKIHPYRYDENDDHNILTVEAIKEI